MTVDFKNVPLTEPLNKLLVPISSSVGSTLQDAWELVFGGFGTFVEKKRLSRLQALEDFKSSLETKVAAIPDENLVEPPLAIVGPALDASKYYFEEPELREMFANLISSSMDSEKATSVLPCFTEIIKQMSALDAQNLACFRNSNAGRFPLAEYRAQSKDRGYQIVQTNVFLANPNEQDIAKQSVSIAALARLGLVTITYDRAFTDESFYEAFSNTPEFLALADALKRHAPDKTLISTSGEVYLTPLGQVFIDVCIPRDQP